MHSALGGKMSKQKKGGNIINISSDLGIIAQIKDYMIILLLENNFILCG